MFSLMGFSGSLPLCVTVIDIICMFIDWANKDARLLALSVCRITCTAKVIGRFH